MTIKFAKNISSWAAAMGKKEVVIVSSLDSGKMPRCDMIGYTFLDHVTCFKLKSARILLLN
jgi:hypothetical protein